MVIAKLNSKDDGNVRKDDGLWDKFFRRLSPGVSSDINTSNLAVFYDENTTASQRTETIRVSANGASNSPMDVTAIQPGVDSIGTDGEDRQPDDTDTDNDNDGIDDNIENAGPNYGDGNNDGIADSLQNNVTSIRSYSGGEYITLASPAGTSLSNCQAVDNPATDSAPDDIEFPYGLINFTINGISQGGGTTLMLYYPANATL